MSQVESPPNPLSQAQSAVNPRHSAAPVDGAQCYTPPASRSLSLSPSSTAPSAEPKSWRHGEKRGRQDTHTQISRETHLSANTDDTCDTSDEDPRPARRRKLHLIPAAVTAPLHILSPSTTSLEAGDVQLEADHKYSPILVDNEHRRSSRSSRSPSTAADAVSAAEYQEWSFQGFLKRTKIGDNITYNLEFKLPSVTEYLHLPISPETFGIR